MSSRSFLGMDNNSKDSSESRSPKRSTSTEVTRKRKQVDDEASSEEPNKRSRVSTGEDDVKSYSNEVASNEEVSVEARCKNVLSPLANDPAPKGNDSNENNNRVDLNYPSGSNGDVDTVNINVRCGGKFSVQIALKSTIASFKKLIAENHGIPADQQRLISEGRLLKDNQTLESYGLGEDDTVFLLRRPAPTHTNHGTNSFPINARGATGTMGNCLFANLFHDLQQMYESEEAFQNAIGMGNNSPSTISVEASAPSPFPNTNPLPNPWSSTTTGAAQNDLGDMLCHSIRQRGISISQMLLTVLFNTHILSQMLSANPGQHRMLNLISLRRATQNPGFLHLASSPEMLERFLSLQHDLLIPFSRQQPTRELGQNDGGDMGRTGGKLGHTGGDMGQNGGDIEPQSPEQLYAAQLSQLQEMGFSDAQENIRALIATSGNVHVAIERLLGGNSMQ